MSETLSGSVRLFNADCLTVIPTLGPVSHVICDPPYENHMHAAKSGRARRLRTDGHQDPAPLDFSSIDGLREAATGLLTDLCGGWFVAFCTPEGVAAWRDAIEATGVKYKRACIWVKPDSAPQFNGQGPAMGAECFVTAWCGSGFSRWNGGGGRNVFTHLTNQADRHGEHPTEKPVSLLMEIIEKFTNPGDPRYFAIAEERISDALARPDMFISAARAVEAPVGSLFAKLEAS